MVEPARAHQEDVTENGLQSRAMSLVHQIIRLSGSTLSEWCRDEAEMKLIKLAESSEEARREMRVTMIEEMIRMHNSRRYQKKLIDVYKFTERFPSIFLVLQPFHPLWSTLDPKKPGECLPPSPAEAPISDVMSDNRQFVPLVEQTVVAQEAVNDIKREAKALVRKLICVTGHNMYKELRDEDRQACLSVNGGMCRSENEDDKRDDPDAEK